MNYHTHQETQSGLWRGHLVDFLSSWVVSQSGNVNYDVAPGCKHGRANR